MTRYEIQDEIRSLIERNEDIILEGHFTLNPEIQKNNARIKELQSICAHEFDNGFCKWCFAEEK